jgi:hypothetical protein
MCIFQPLDMFRASLGHFLASFSVLLWFFNLEDTFHFAVRKNVNIINIVTRETEFLEETGGPIQLKFGLFFPLQGFDSWDCSQIWKIHWPTYVCVTSNNITWLDIQRAVNTNVIVIAVTKSASRVVNSLVQEKVKLTWCDVEAMFVPLLNDKTVYSSAPLSCFILHKWPY